jgi:hypothetical protein
MAPTRTWMQRRWDQLNETSPHVARLARNLGSRHIARLLHDVQANGISSFRFNVTRQTPAAKVHALIKKLMPQDCGKDLIRIGGTGDGGYLIPDDLEGIEYCFSPGVGNLSTFENDLADRNIRCFLADYSVDSQQITRADFTFDKKFLGSSDHGCFFTLASWKDKYLKDYTGDLILQMDIEESEYQVILNVPDQLLDQFRIISIEFHALHKLFDPFAFQLISSCFDKLLEYFYVVHLHPCNAEGCVRVGKVEVPINMEFTFLNKKRVNDTKPQRVFPHRLDEPNDERRPLPLPKCWYVEL